MLEYEKNQKNVGDKNIETAFKIIKGYNLNLPNKDIGGSFGMIYFFSDTCEVYIPSVKE